jgi:transposase
LFWLTDAQMARLQLFFPKSHGLPRVDDRRVLSGINSINRNGLRCCGAPKEYGPPKSLYKRWKRWSDKGIFARLMEGLASEAAIPKTVMIDATYLKASARSKGGPVHPAKNWARHSERLFKPSQTRRGGGFRANN